MNRIKFITTSAVVITALSMVGMYLVPMAQAAFPTPPPYAATFYGPQSDSIAIDAAGNVFVSAAGWLGFDLGFSQLGYVSKLNGTTGTEVDNIMGYGKVAMDAEGNVWLNDGVNARAYNSTTLVAGRVIPMQVSCSAPQCGTYTTNNFAITSVNGEERLYHEWVETQGAGTYQYLHVSEYRLSDGVLLRSIIAIGGYNGTITPGPIAAGRGRVMVAYKLGNYPNVKDVIGGTENSLIECTSSEHTDLPKGMGVDADGGVWLAYASGNADTSVYKVDAWGSFCGRWYKLYNNNLNSATGIAFNAAGTRVYVSQYGSTLVFGEPFPTTTPTPTPPPISQCALDALAAIGKSADDFPPSALQGLENACKGNNGSKETTVPANGTGNGGVKLDNGDVLVIGTGGTENGTTQLTAVEGDNTSMLILGDGAHINGSVKNVGTVYVIGHASISGGFTGIGTLSYFPGASLTVGGQFSVANIVYLP